MSIFETEEGLEALEEVGGAVEQLGRSIRRVVAVGRKARRAQGADDAKGIEQFEEIARLWARLGRPNRAFLYETAKANPPGETFSIAALAADFEVEKGAVRARLMNLGRSLKSLGPAAPVLWDVYWDDDERANVYEFDADAWRAILAIEEEGA